MTTAEPTARLERFPLVFRLLEVKRVTWLTPRMVRVTLGGDQLAGFARLAPDDHLKLIFPLAGEEKPTLPTQGENGWAYPEDRPRPPLRDFTPRRYDPAAGELDIDLVLHGDGPASAWAAKAAPGQFVGTAGPRGSYIVSPTFDWSSSPGTRRRSPPSAAGWRICRRAPRPGSLSKSTMPATRFRSRQTPISS